MRIPLPACLIGTFAYGVVWYATWTGLSILTRRSMPLQEAAYWFSILLAWAATVSLWWELHDVIRLLGARSLVTFYRQNSSTSSCAVNTRSNMVSGYTVA